MNHDVTHCADVNPSCPKSCYWFKLEQDLKKRWIELAGVPISYMHLLGGKSCRKETENALN